MLKVIQPFLDPRDPNDVFSHAQWPETPFYLSLTSVRHRAGLLLQRLGCLTVRHPWAFTITQTSISVLPQNWSAAGPSKWAHASCADAVEVCAEPILQHSLLVRHFPLDCTEHGLNTADMSLRIPLLGWKVLDTLGNYIFKEIHQWDYRKMISARYEHVYIYESNITSSQTRSSGEKHVLSYGKITYRSQQSLYDSITSMGSL